ncbi:MAG: glycosyltransferase family 4 protein [Verrucomicrobiota bacterium]|jgi:glycosyltransferase involved in cell wall biosynthesis|nr:glycosyltransferase family 4 protein [Verrucomicrobiota bacterium]
MDPSASVSSLPLRVLFVNRMACLERGGGETFDLEISRHLALRGVEVAFLSGAPQFRRAPMPLDRARVLHTPWLRWFPWDKVKGGWRVRQAEFAWFQWRAARWIARHAADFDLIQVCELPDLVYGLKKRGVKTPVVMRLTAPNYYDPRGGVSLADALIASGTSIEQLKIRGHGAVQDIPNAVDSELFRPCSSEARAAYGAGTDEFVVLYVARFQAFKNHAMLLDAFARFLKVRPDARLWLAGSGPLRQEMARRAEQLGIAERVRFLGEVPYARLPSVYAAADINVISSDYESFCFAAVEGMSMALPTLTTACGWVPRLVADGAGVVVPVGDAGAFAAELVRLAADPEARRRLGRRGRELVLERHTWTVSADKLLRLYQAVCFRCSAEVPGRTLSG